MEFCDSLQNEATMAVNPDERRIYVYQDTKGNGDIFYSDFSTNRFQAVTHLDNKKINTDSWETHCTVTPDGETMYFVSDRKGGYGARDIYYAKRQSDGTWGDPVNAGPNINGPMDEESPFVSIDNSTLYFSSNGNKSMGGFDIFMSKFENGTWGKATNLGYPINSTCDDLFYTTTSDGLTGYITSVRSDGKGDKDIYQVKNNYLGVKNIAVLNGRINVIGGNQIPEDVYVTLKCLDCEKPYEKKIYPRMRDGGFTNSLEPCKEYEVSFSYKDNAKKNFYAEKFKTDCTKEYSEVYREFWLDLNKQMMVKPYFFAGTITDEKSKEKLDNVNVQIKNVKSNDDLAELNTRKGLYKSDTVGGMKKGDNVKFSVTLTKEGYLTKTFEQQNLLGDDSKIVINGVMERIEIGLDLAKFIKPIYFDFNKSNIRKDAAKELDVIVRIMKENPSIKIELGSHTDTRGSDESNLSLSDRRAKSSAEYIISKGIDRSRITGKGYGETKLIVSDAEIEAMPAKEAQEAAHQLNRRTEFLIVE
jgi:outer membrane protein OmpA-like peptidoglycan-associated protein